MSPEGAASPGSPRARIAEHEDAAHEKRNWVRLTYRCNDRCVFCLDSFTHDGSNRADEEIKQQILDGRRKGAERLILSGGEPTIHPRYVDFIRLGRLAGYSKIQTVTNGRMFAYADFLARCLDAGLSEITFSVHGPDAKVHDALVGTRGAFDEEMHGLRNALADGRPVVNIDICVNRGNVRHLPEMLRKFTDLGVREFDLLQVIPFGRAYTEGRETLFYDLEENRSYIQEALAWSNKPGIHVWMNRFPPAHLEGYEHLIQDPYKLNDEVRGRKEEYAHLLEVGEPLDCRQPHRCNFCYLQNLCDTLDVVRDRVARADFEVIRIDTEWEAGLPPIYGGDPASRRRSEQQNQVVVEAAAGGVPARVRLPLAPAPTRPVYAPIPELVARAGAHTAWIVAPDIERAAAALAPLLSIRRVELELGDWSGADATALAALRGDRTVTRVVCRDHRDAQSLLDVPGSFEVVLDLARRNEAWLLGLAALPSRLVLRQPTHDRLTGSEAEDLDLRAFFAGFPWPVPVEGVPACILGRPPRERPAVLDSAMMTPDGRLEIFRYARRYILDGYFTKSLRCKRCIHFSECRGLPINYVRAHGYGELVPVEARAGDT